MSCRFRVQAALRDGRRRGLQGRALEAHVNTLADVAHWTPAQIHAGSRVYRELVWPVTRPPRPKTTQGRLPF